MSLAAKGSSQHFFASSYDENLTNVLKIIHQTCEMYKASNADFFLHTHLSAANRRRVFLLNCFIVKFIESNFTQLLSLLKCSAR